MDRKAMVEAIKKAPDPGAAAGTWWAFALHAPEFDNGDDSRTGSFVQMMARQLAESNPQNESALEVFAGKLTKKVNKALKRAGEWGITLSVDYHPDRMLSEAAEEAHLTVSTLGWPWKTHMTVTRSCVSISAGYQAPSEVIWGESVEASV